MDAQVVDTILHKHPKDPSSIIQVMLDIQNELYYLPRDVIEYVSEYLQVPLSRTYNLATFYKAFSLHRKGRHLCSVCTGTACHVRGAPRLLDKLEVERKALGANICFGIAGAAAVTSAVLFYVGWRRAHRRTSGAAALVPAESGAVLQVGRILW